jgi:hypothetical protein
MDGLSRTHARAREDVLGSAGSPTPLPPIITAYPECTFIEVKAVKGAITLSYARYQIAGMLDVLSRCDAASSTGRDRGYPSLYFIVTNDTIIAVATSPTLAECLAECLVATTPSATPCERSTGRQGHPSRPPTNFTPRQTKTLAPCSRPR